MACSGATPPAALADVTNRGGAAPGEPLPKRPRLGSPSPAPPAPGPAPPAAASPTVGSPGKGGGLPGVGSPTKTAPLAMRDTPRVASRRAVPPPPPPAKPSRNARPRPKFTPKSTNLQALWQNSWHDISIVAGPHERGDDRCYDVVLHDGNSVLTEWPEGLIRRAAGAAAPSQPTDGQLKRFPLGCIVWARVKGAHDWSPGWVIEMPKGEAPPHMRNNLDAYCVQLFGSGLYAFVEDTYDDTDVCPFDVEPPRSEDRLMFTADADQKIAAIQQALQIYFHGMSPETQEGVLRWRGPLRIVHRMISRMNGLWDQAAKAEALELTISELQAQLEANTQHQLCLEQDNAMLRQQVDGSGTRSLGRRLSAVSRMESENLELQRQVALLQGELQQGCRPAEVAGDPELVGRLRGDVAALEAQRDHFRALIEESAAALEEQTKAAAHWQEQCAARDATIAARDATIAVRDAAIAGLEAERRRLRYAILELKGNLRVVCRVRPPTAQEAQQPLALFRFPEDDTLQLCPADGRAQHSFRLDRVFQPAASNADVFHEVAPLVQSVLDGYNVCLFTYGQTGSGKTFTMAGPPEANDEAPVAEKDVGLIPRAMELIFANIEQLRGEGWDHEVAVKVVEIHNEVVYDLLPPPEPGTTCPGASPFRTPLQRPRPSKASATPTAAGRPAGWRPLATPSTPSTPSTPRPMAQSRPAICPSPRPGTPRTPGPMQPPSPQQQRRLSLKFSSIPTRVPSRIPKPGAAVGRGPSADPAGTPAAAAEAAEAVSTHVIRRLADLQALLRRAAEQRTVAQTGCNDHSSRSHFLCLVSVRGTHAAQGLGTHGVLNMVDLAGSERLSKSGAVGEQLRETQHINRSLFCLRDVIAALGSHARFVPFRNSKLTWLLKDSLGNNAKVMTLVTLSPTLEAEPETLCSLRFAARAHSCELGTPKRDVTGAAVTSPGAAGRLQFESTAPDTS